MSGVAFARKMSEKELFKTRRRKAFHEPSRVVVGKMSALTENPALKTLGARACAKHHRIVIRLQRRDIGLGKIPADGIKGRADICRVKISFTLGFHEKTDGIGNIMRNGKRQYRKRPRLKFLIILEYSKFVFRNASLRRDSLGRHHIGVKLRLREARMKRRKTPDMIVVIVGEYYGDDRVGINRHLIAASHKLPA